ncbi:MAG: MBL fold metallo-hydrolase [Anaerolineae bacterium]|nr:MBL fold metallo-hydrolase [Anaerolineae bacterium]
MAQSRFFDVQQLADGIYAAIADEASGALGNTAFVDLGDRTLLFDTTESPMIAQALRAAAEQLTGHPVGVVAISHGHSDHWYGNQAFAGLPIVATTRSLDLMRFFADDTRADQHDPSAFDAFLAEQRAALDAETDPRRRANLTKSLARFERHRADLPTFDLTLPNQTFDGKIVFHGPRRTVELVALETVHSPGDCYLLLPDERIALIGDLGFFDRQPFMPFGDPEAWVQQIEQMLAWDVEVFVPGHGPVGGKTHLKREQEYITTIETMVREAIAAGRSLDDLLKQRLPAPFDAWSIDGTAGEYNLRFVYERVSGAANKL